MKMTTFIMIGSMLLGNMLFAAGNKTNVAKEMGLKKVVVEGATVYYEPALEGKLDVFKKVYSDFRAKVSTPAVSAAPSYSKIASKKTAIVDDIYKIVGGKNDELKTELTKVAEQFIELNSSISMPLSGTNNVIYLLLQSTTKNYLRSGGVLPNLSYDKKTDSAEYYLGFGSNKDNASNQELLLPFPSADKIAPFINAIFSAMTKLAGSSLGATEFLIIHEVAEFAIVRRLNTVDPYKRWFTDGFANAITYEIVRRNFSQQDADAFLELYSTEPYQTIKKQIDLQYWMCAQFTFTNQWPLEKEKEHIQARYRFATEQARRIVKEHGIECVKKILDTYASGVKKHGAVFTAIRKATGDDTQKHMMQYQGFKTRDEGYALYKKQYELALKAGRGKDMIYSMLRMLDLRGEQPLDNKSLKLRSNIAHLLYLTGKKEQGIKSITEFADWMCLSNNTDNHYVARRLVIFLALKIERPEIAFEYAIKILDGKPNDVFALTIMMKKATSEKELKKAREIAKKICDNEPDKSSPWYKDAKQVLGRQEK